MKKLFNKVLDSKFVNFECENGAPISCTVVIIVAIIVSLFI